MISKLLSKSRSERSARSTRIEPLEDRIAPALTFVITAGIATVTDPGDGAAHTVLITDVGGTLTVTDGGTPVAPTGDAATLSTITTIRYVHSGGAFSDSVTIDPLNASNGPNSLDLKTYSFSASTGGDTFNAASVGLGSVTFTGGTGNDSFLSGGGTTTATGGGGNDTLTAANTANTWLITGSNAGTVNGAAGVTFNSISQLVGGSAADSFTLAGGTISRTIDGGAGTDTLTGGNIANSWTLTVANGGTVTGVTLGFANIENLTGGSAADSFLLSGGTLSGAIAGGAGTDTLTGGNVANTFTVTAANAGSATGVVGGFAAVENLTGGSTTDSFVLSGGTLSGLITGGSGTDTLTGDNLANTFTVTGADAGSATGVTGGFAGVENLTGGSITDSFLLSGGMLSGAIAGGAGTDTLTGDNVANTFTVTAANGGSLTGVAGGFGGIEALVGGSSTDSFALASGITFLGAITGGAGTDAVVGANVANTFTVTGANAGSVTGLSGGFSQIENLTGGTSTDAFVISASGSLAGMIAGGAGADTLTGANVANTFTITGSDAGTLTGTNGVGSFTGIESLVGGSTTDTLTGNNVATTWTITSTTGGTVTGSTSGFSGFEVLAGGSSTDSFVLASGITFGGSIAGGTGTDTVTGASVANTFTVTSANAGTVTGISGSFSAIENLTGGTSTDSFVIGASGSLTGTITGAVGVDTLTGANVANTFTITGPDAGTLTGTNGVGNFTGIESLVGGSSADTLVGFDGANTWTVTSATGGAVTGLTTGFSGFEALGGGSSTDSFLLASGITFLGTIAGGLGTDTVAGANVANTFTVTGANAGTVTGLSGGFTAIENLTGGTTADSFVLNGGTLSGAVTGGVGTDTLTGDGVANTFTVTAGNAGSVTGVTGGFTTVENLTGGSSTDSFVLNGGTLSGAVAGGAGMDTLTGDGVANTFTVTSGNAGSATGVTGGFTTLENLTGGSSTDAFTLSGGTLGGAIVGGAGVDMLTGDNLANTFTLTTANGGTVTGVAGGFTTVENLTGGTGTDSFTLGAGTSNAGTLTGLIDGNSGSDVLTGANLSNTWGISSPNAGSVNGVDGGFTRIDNLVGGAASDQFTFANAGAITELLDGGAGNNFLTGDDDGNAFTVTAANSGTLVTKTSGWTNIQVLTGGTGADTFLLTGGTLSGSIDGNSGVDTLTGDDLSNSWTVTGSNLGTVTGVANGFSRIDNLSGGTAVDVFEFSAAGALTGMLVGGAGADVFDISTAASGQSVNLTGSASGGFSGTTASVQGGFTAIDELDGNNTDLAGTADPATTWKITGTNSGTFEIDGTPGVFKFRQTRDLVGKTGEDTFVFLGGGNISGVIEGGPKIGQTDVFDLLDFSALTSAQAIQLTGFGTADGYNGATSLISGGFKNINEFKAPAGVTGTLTGLDATNEWRITDTNTGAYLTNDGTNDVQFDFSNVANVTGGTGADTFKFFGSGNLTGTVDGDRAGSVGGTDKLDFSAVGSQTVTLTSLSTVPAAGFNGVTALIGGGFKHFDGMIGSSAGTTDKLIGGLATPPAGGLNTDSTWAVNAPNAGSYTDDTSARAFTFSDTENLTGGTAKDKFVFSATGALSGAIDGDVGAGSDTDTLDFSAVGSQTVTLTGLSSVPATGFDGTTALISGGFKHLDALIGSSAGTTDKLVGLNADSTWAITAPEAGSYTNDTPSRSFTFTGTENLTGGTAKDKFVFSATGSLTGVIDGDTGTTGDTDTLDFRAVGSQTVTLTALSTGPANGFDGVTSLITGGFKHLDGMIGSTVGVADKLIGGQVTPLAMPQAVGLNTDSTWAITGPDAGRYTDDVSSRSFTFTGTENLTGGTGKDKFVFSATPTNSPISALRGAIDGDVGAAFNEDTLDFSAVATQAVTFTFAGTRDGSQGTTTPRIGGGFDNINKVINSSITGGNTVNTWLIDGPNTGLYNGVRFEGTPSLTGGTLKDTFTFTVAGTLTGTINGGADDGSGLGENYLVGDNGLSVDDRGNTFTIDGPNSGKLTGLALSNTNVITDDLIKTSGWSNIQHLVGGSKDDTFIFPVAGVLFTLKPGTDGKPGPGSIDGGAGVNTLQVTKDNNVVLTDSAVKTGKVTDAVQTIVKDKRGRDVASVRPFTVEYTKDDGSRSNALNITITTNLVSGNVISTIAKAIVTGGATKNILDAGQFSGTTELSGLRGIDVLIAGKGSSKLYGDNALTPNGENKNKEYDHFYVRDNPGGAVTAEIYATAYFSNKGAEGNTIHFRESSVGVTYTLPTVPKLKKGLPVGGNWQAPDGSAVATNVISVPTGGATFTVKLQNGVLQHLEGSEKDDRLKGNKLLNSIWGGAGVDDLRAVGRDVLLLGDPTGNPPGSVETFGGTSRGLVFSADPNSTAGFRITPFFLNIPKTGIVVTTILGAPGTPVLKGPAKDFFHYSPAAIFELRSL